MEGKNLVVVSFYDRRPISNLEQLLQSMCEFDAGAEYSLVIVVNRTTDEALKFDAAGLQPEVHYRHNIGMNIGAWDYGWRLRKDFDRVLFLQDDCYMVANNWLAAVESKLADSQLGLLGETFNNGWNLNWDALRIRLQNTPLPEHLIDGEVANRIDVYLHCLQNYGIDPGQSGLHLRSLCFAARMETLCAIDGFPIGHNYGECIAAEIGISKKVEALGLRLALIGDEEFAFIRHLEWNQDYPGGRFTKLPVVAKQIGRLKKENQQLRDKLQLQKRAIHDLQEKLAMPRWRQIAQRFTGNSADKRPLIDEGVG